MVLDLSSLDDINNDQVGAGAPSGKPVLISLADIDPDPAQPRVEFDAEAMSELEASIRERGVKSPISLKPHPVEAGRWIINDGERRWLASKAAGLDAIPAFVDETHDSYDQVIANLQREALTPIELAKFIAARVAEQERPADIARKLGKSKAFVSAHLALADLPEPIARVYNEGLTRSYKTLYELRRLSDEFPDQVGAWCSEATEITRANVQALADALHGISSPALELAAGADASFDHRSSGEVDGSRHGGEGADHDEDWIHGDDGGNESDGVGQEDDGVGQEELEVQQIQYHNPEHEKEKREPKLPDPNKIKKPILLVVYDERAAMVMLNRRPTNHGLLWIKYEDNGDEAEVDAGACSINSLIEASA